MSYYQYPQQQIPNLDTGLTSVGNALAAWGQRRQQQKQNTDINSAVQGLLAPDESGQTEADKLSAAKNPALATLGWMQQNDFLDTFLDPKRQPALAIVLSAVTPPVSGKTVDTMTGDEWASKNGLPNPERFKGFVVQQDAKGHSDWVYKPQEEKPAEAPKTRTIIRGDQQINQEFTNGAWHDVGSGPRWEGKEPPNPVDTLTAEEKAALEQASGMPAGSLADRVIQRDRVTGRLHNLPGELDALQKMLLGSIGTPAAPQPAQNQQSLWDRAKQAVGLGGASSGSNSIADRFKAAP